MKIIVVQGPTASGKTGLSVQIAKTLKTVVISADSRQFYSEMNIGTAKPTIKEMDGVPHYFIGSHQIKDELTAAEFASSARKLLDELKGKYEHIVVVGGSGMFVDALINGLDDLPTDSKVKQNLQENFERFGLQFLQEYFFEKDPTGKDLIDFKNPMRLMRALEIMELTGKPWSEQRLGQQSPIQGKVFRFAINWDRETLYRRINQRVDEMMENGLLEEVKSLSQYKNTKPLNTVGYKEIFEYLDGNCDLPTAIDKIKQHTRNYAKRQLTWLRRYDDLVWLNPKENCLELVIQRCNSN